jgi:hypothetical protein
MLLKEQFFKSNVKVKRLVLKVDEYVTLFLMIAIFKVTLFRDVTKSGFNKMGLIFGSIKCFHN